MRLEGSALSFGCVTRVPLAAYVVSGALLAACSAAPSGPASLTPTPGALTTILVSPSPSPFGTPTELTGVPGGLSGEIAFSARDSVVLMDLVTGSAEVLVAGAFPAWSPDGTRIAFASRGDPELWLMNADGSGQQRIGIGFAPRWSPDGSRIAANGDPIDFGTLVVVNADGSGEALLSATGGLSASWSPDGTRIAFVRAGRIPGGGDFPELAVVAVDGDAPRGLGMGVDPDWSPDGRWIAASGHEVPIEGETATRLLRVDPDTGERSVLPGPPGWVQAPAWSPDGGRIAFVSDRELYVLTVADGTWIQLTRGLAVFPSRPAWSPDGAWLAFTAAEAPATDLLVVGSEGQGLWRLTTGAGALDPEWRPALP